jgi:hypothetical protein
MMMRITTALLFIGTGSAAPIYGSALHDDSTTDTTHDSILSAALRFLDSGTNRRALALPWYTTVPRLYTVDLRTAENYAILTKAGVTNIPGHSSITGNVGVGPIASTAITGFDLVMHADNEYSTSDQVFDGGDADFGKIFAADYAWSGSGSPILRAVDDMETAYTNAASRPTTSVGTPDAAKFFNVQAGLIADGTTFTSGVYTWTTAVTIASGKDVYIQGTATDIFIFQISNELVVGSMARMNLRDLNGNACVYQAAPGGSDTGAATVLQAVTDAGTGNTLGTAHTGGCPKASNIFWQVATSVAAEATSHLEGVFLVKTLVAFHPFATLNGRVLAQTAATLMMNEIVQPPRVV